MKCLGSEGSRLSSGGWASSNPSKARGVDRLSSHSAGRPPPGSMRTGSSRLSSPRGPCRCRTHPRSHAGPSLPQPSSHRAPTSVHLLVCLSGEPADIAARKDRTRGSRIPGISGTRLCPRGGATLAGSTVDSRRRGVLGPPPSPEACSPQPLRPLCFSRVQKTGLGL